MVCRVDKCLHAPHCVHDTAPVLNHRLVDFCWCKEHPEHSPLFHHRAAVEEKHTVCSMAAPIFSAILWLKHCFQSRVSKLAEYHHSPLRPAMSGSRKEKGDMSLTDMLSLWYDCYRTETGDCHQMLKYFVEQQMCLHTWKESAEDWVEMANLRADYAT